MRVVRLRTGVVLGMEGGALRAMLRPFRLGLGGPVGTGLQWISWIHAGDLAGLLLHAIDCPEVAGPLNGTAPEPVRQNDFARALGRALGRPAILPAPAFVLGLLLGEMADSLLLTGQRAVPKKALDSRFLFHFPTLDGALADLLSRR